MLNLNTREFIFELHSVYLHYDRVSLFNVVCSQLTSLFIRYSCEYSRYSTVVNARML